MTTKPCLLSALSLLALLGGSHQVNAQGWQAQPYQANMLTLIQTGTGSSFSPTLPQIWANAGGPNTGSSISLEYSRGYTYLGPRLNSYYLYPSLRLQETAAVGGSSSVGPQDGSANSSSQVQYNVTVVGNSSQYYNAFPIFISPRIDYDPWWPVRMSSTSSYGEIIKLTAYASIGGEVGSGTASSYATGTSDLNPLLIPIN